MRQIFIHCKQNETQVALTENGLLTEFYVEKPAVKQLAGNIYKGRVVNVLPGMQAAFVDIGLSKNAFLYVDDLLPAHLDKQPKVKPSIGTLVRPGQELLVQIMKEPVKSKGARVTTHYSLPGRWLVYMPHADYIGISRKIESETERTRLKEIAERIREDGEGLIVRTIAADETVDAIMEDLRMMRAAWKEILDCAEGVTAPAEVFQELDLISRLVRDVFSDQVDELWVDHPAQAQEIRSYVERVMPDLVDRVKLYSETECIYRRFGIETELNRAFRQKVWLKSGGYIVWDETEALTAIDVNTGKYTGSVDLEETVFNTNMEAAEEIARLLRLRDAGGIIIVDFIDMELEEHRRQIEATLEMKFKQDRTKTLVIGWTRLGLLELTRKKVRENMNHLFYERCSHCGGAGRIYLRREE